MSSLKLEMVKSPSLSQPQSLGVHPNDYIFHSRDFLEIFNGAHTVDALGFLLSQDGDPVASLNGFTMKASRFLPSSLQGRYTIFASPFFCDSAKKEELFEFMLPGMDKLLRHNCLFAEWRNTEDPSAYREVFEKHGWSYIPYQNYLVDLTPGVEEIWKSIHRNARNNINKAKSKGVVVRDATPSEASTVYAMIRRLYDAKHLPLFDKQVFLEAFRRLLPNGMLRATVAEHENQIVGTRLALLYNGIVFDWYAASDRAYSNCYPNEVLAWDMIAFGAANAFRIFDFGGAGIKGEQYGPARFKQKFNGQLVEHGRFIKPFRPLLYKAMNYLYEKRKELAGANTSSGLQGKEMGDVRNIGMQE